MAVPAVIPVINPDDDPAVATDGLLVLHVPVVVVLASVVVWPTHTVAMPVIGATTGTAFTVTVRTT